MASTSGSGCEIRKFDTKNFALCKEMMQDVLVPSGKTLEEWKSVDEHARSTIRMDLAEKVYLSMAKKKTAFELWENLHVGDGRRRKTTRDELEKPD